MPFDGYADSVSSPTARLLRSARALIASEDHWLQGRYETGYDEYCAIGALQEAGFGREDDLVERAHALLLDVAESRGFETVAAMNDGSDHASVLAAFDAAIAVAERRSTEKSWFGAARDLEPADAAI